MKIRKEEVKTFVPYTLSIEIENDWEHRLLEKMVGKTEYKKLADQVGTTYPAAEHFLNKLYDKIKK
jgi:hypothetical protein